MHLLTVAAFACLFWQAEDPGLWVVVGTDHAFAIGFLALTPIPLLGLFSLGATHRAIRLIKTRPQTPQCGPQFHHRVMAAIRGLILTHLFVLVFLTDWPAWFHWAPRHPALQILGDWIVISPFFLGLLATWLTSFPLENFLRAESIKDALAEPTTDARHWGLQTYLDFQVRHHFLIVAVPMTLILFCAHLTRGYEDRFMERTGWKFAPDFLLAASAAFVFLFSPALLRRIWRTSPLEKGLIRDRLEQICDRVGLRCREILVWKSDGLMINAAVMGLIPQLRYVMLSDGLLASMNVPQIEAVFGHEAGHVRHRHIPHFLVFAFVGWLVVAGVLETTTGPGATAAFAWGSKATAKALGVLVAAAVWFGGFGWLSRRFERQADLFGAQCVSPGPDECHRPCSVHAVDGSVPVHPARVCMSGAAIFASALDRVAVLNGIPHEERSWRHASIATRIRFLMSAAGDPALAIQFDRQLRMVKIAMLVVATLGAAGAGVLWLGSIMP